MQTMLLGSKLTTSRVARIQRGTGGPDTPGKLQVLYVSLSTSLSLEPTSFNMPFSNFKPSINKYLLDQWQTSLNNSTGNKLLEIKPTIGEHQSVVRNIRKEEVALSRLHLGLLRLCCLTATKVRFFSRRSQTVNSASLCCLIYHYYVVCLGYLVQSIKRL